MEKEIRDIVGNSLDELDVTIDSVCLNNNEKPKHLEICLDSEKVLDLDLITKASKIINELIDNSNFNLDSLDAFKLPEAPTKQEEKDPFNEMLNQVQDDGIESLDFLPPGVQSEVKSDISYLTEKVDRLITDMQNDTHVVTNKEDASNYTKYTIVINKSA